MGGYDRPILHGLCTFGHVGRAVLRSYCGNDPRQLKVLDVRFSGVVFPGETIVTEMWKISDDGAYSTGQDQGTRRADDLLCQRDAGVVSWERQLPRYVAP